MATFEKRYDKFLEIDGAVADKATALEVLILEGFSLKEIYRCLAKKFVDSDMNMNEWNNY